MSKHRDLSMRALRCMMVHDIFSEALVDSGGELGKGLEGCPWGSRAACNRNHETTVYWLS